MLPKTLRNSRKRLGWQLLHSRVNRSHSLTHSDIHSSSFYLFYSSYSSNHSHLSSFPLALFCSALLILLTLLITRLTRSNYNSIATNSITTNAVHPIPDLLYRYCSPGQSLSCCNLHLLGLPNLNSFASLVYFLLPYTILQLYTPPRIGLSYPSQLSVFLLLDLAFLATCQPQYPSWQTCFD